MNESRTFTIWKCNQRTKFEMADWSFRRRLREMRTNRSLRSRKIWYQLRSRLRSCCDDGITIKGLSLLTYKIDAVFVRAFKNCSTYSFDTLPKCQAFHHFFFFLPIFISRSFYVLPPTRKHSPYAVSDVRIQSNAVLLVRASRIPFFFLSPTPPLGSAFLLVIVVDRPSHTRTTSTC